MRYTKKAISALMLGSIVTVGVIQMNIGSAGAAEENTPVVGVGALTESFLASVPVEADQEENEVDMISVYPNPAKDIVKLSAANHHLSAVRIYNCLGMMVEEMNVRTQNASDEIEINVSGYKSGIYFINVYDNNGNVATKKISVINN